MSPKTQTAVLEMTGTAIRPASVQPASAEVTADVLAKLDRLAQSEEREAADQARRIALIGPDPQPRIIERDRNGVQVATFGDDGPTPERVAKSGGMQYGVLIGKEEVPAARVEDSTMLRKYLRDKAIGNEQFKAGLLLHADFITAGIEPRVISSYREAVGGKGSWDMLSASQSDARRRYVQAMTFVHHRFRPVLVHVVCLGFTAADWALSTGRRGTTAQTVGMENLRYGLDDLMAWYDLVRPNRR